jgi:hypothetical protein
MRYTRYTYTIRNPITGLHLTRDVWAKTMADARSKVSLIAFNFGKSTRVVKVEQAAAPELPLQPMPSQRRKHRV